jgi:hypothetical protein
MTTTTETTALKVGDLVTYEGHAATVTEPVSDGAPDMSNYVLLRFAATSYPTGAWQDRGYPSEDGQRYYWVHRTDDSRMTRREPEPYVPSLGDRVNLTRNGETTTGTVYALQHGDGADTPVRYVWVSTSDTYDYPYADFVRQSAYAHRVSVPHEDAPEGTRGHWFDVRDDYTVSPAEPVGITSATPEGTPSGPAQAPAESPEVTALKAQVEAAESRARTLQQEVNAMRHDLTIIGEHLKATAERHEWCGEYEEHLERLLGALSGYSDDYLREAAERMTDYRVTVTYTTTVRASDSSSAIDEVRELVYGDSDTVIRYGDWDAEEE